MIELVKLGGDLAQRSTANTDPLADTIREKYPVCEQFVRAYFVAKETFRVEEINRTEAERKK